MRAPALRPWFLWPQAARVLVVWLGLSLVPPVSAFAQRELHWDRLDVVAHLNADGSLTVTETHTIVFTGDWNGGERKFNIRPRQQFSFTGIARGGPGGWQALTEDSSLDDVDEYAWTGPNTLRWRSRRPSDAPFSGTSIRYEIRYVLSNILLKEEDRYRLDHDFAFPDRAGAINRFELRLTLDPVWDPLADVRPVYTAGPIAAGRSFVLDIPLHYAGVETPAAIDRTRKPEIGYAVEAVLAVTLLAVVWFFVREQRMGRFAPLTAEVDDAWIREHILKHPAEVVAAAWDENVGTAEVVALIARMVNDGQLGSSVGKGTGKNVSMTLRLKVDRATLNGHERALVDKLFFNNRTETNTSIVRDHYRATGFNPAGEIGPALESAVDRVLPGGRPSRRFSMALGAIVFALALGVLVVRWYQGYPSAFLLVLVAVVLAGVGAIAGRQFRCYLEWGRGAALWCLTPALTIAIGSAIYLWSSTGTGDVDFDAITLAGVVAVVLSCTLASINALKSRRSREAIAFRKALTSGRAFFKTQLQHAQPALRDEWYPWLLGLELGKHVDAWSTARAGTASTSDPGGSFGSPTSSSSSHSGSQWTGFGGGRSGGAGASASWQAAATGMAASVSAPSSSGSSGGSSDGGGSSGGGSSGGGGGGGW